MQNPLTLNRYVYCVNNPETNIDPTGHYDYSGWGAGVEIVNGSPSQNYWTWLFNTQKGALINLGISLLVSVFGPLGAGIESEVTAILSASGFLSSLTLDLEPLILDYANGNSGAIAGDMTNFVFDTVYAVFRNANFWQKMTLTGFFGLDAALDIGTAGERWRFS